MPQVPATQAKPPPHWLLAVHAVFVASMIRWMHDPKAGDMPRLLHEQVCVLREHQRAESAAPAEPTHEGPFEVMRKRLGLA